MMRSRISFAKVMITPPANVKKPFALWDGSWDFNDRPTCTIPNPNKIRPMARIREKMNVDRLSTAASGSPAAYAYTVQRLPIATSTE